MTSSLPERARFDFPTMALTVCQHAEEVQGDRGNCAGNMEYLRCAACLAIATRGGKMGRLKPDTVSLVRPN
jgi:hypothetical protein